MTWSVVTNDTTMAVNNSYGANGTQRIAFTLPNSSTIGDIVAIQGMQGGWNIVQGDNQQIILGNKASSVGSSGFAASTHEHDAIELVCLGLNTVWYAKPPVGNINLG